MVNAPQSDVSSVTARTSQWAEDQSLRQMTYLGLYIKCLSLLYCLQKQKRERVQICVKTTNIKFHENQFNGTRHDTFGQTPDIAFSTIAY
jgi:hypothetical protein